MAKEQNTRLSDQEVICTWMAPKPKRGSDGWWEDTAEAAASFRSGWWWVQGTNPEDSVAPRRITFDVIHEVESRLSDEQWRDYEGYAVCWWDGRIKGGFKAIAHASAEQKIKALAAVLRSIVESASEPTEVKP